MQVSQASNLKVELITAGLKLKAIADKMLDIKFFVVHIARIKDKCFCLKEMRDELFEALSELWAQLANTLFASRLKLRKRFGKTNG